MSTLSGSPDFKPESPLAQPAPPGGISVTEQSLQKRTELLVTAFVNEPPLEGNLKNHRHFKQFIALFAGCKGTDLQQVIGELGRLGAKDAQTKVICQQMSTFLLEAEAFVTLLGQNPDWLALKQNIIATLNPAICWDLAKAVVEKQKTVPPEVMARVDKLLQVIEDTAKLYREKQVGQLALRVFSIPRAGPVLQAARKILPKNIVDTVQQRLVGCIVTKTSIVAALKEKPSSVAYAQLLFRKLQNEDPAAASVVLEQVEIECASTFRAIFNEFNTPTTSSDMVLLKRAIDDGVAVDRIKSLMSPTSPLLLRYEQLLRATAGSETFELQKFSDVQVMRIALFIEMQITPAKAAAQKYFLAQETGVRDLHFDWDKKEVYVITDETQSKLQASGTYKKAINAVMLPLENRAKEAAVAVVQLTPVKSEPERPYKTVFNPHTLSLEYHAFIGPLVEFELDLEGIKKEKPFYEALKDVKGVACPRSITDFTMAHVTKPASMSLVLNRADKGELHAVIDKDFRKEGKIDSNKVRQMGMELLNTFVEIHKKGVFHGDAKLANVLVDANYKLLVIDFGFSFFMHAGKQVMPSECLREKNAYAAWWYTPLDLLQMNSKNPTKPSSPERTIADYQKIESYVVGCMMYEMSFGRCNWFNTLINRGYPPRVNQKDMNQFMNEYEDKIHNERERIKKIAIENREPEDHYKFAVCNLMRFTAPNRWSLDTAAAYLKDPIAWKKEYQTDPVAWLAKYQTDPPK